MRLYSYKMTSDTGFAPNPFWGYLTLATCKPGIRRSKRKGDWIAGFTSKALSGDAPGEERLVYLMEVEEILSIADYYRDARFKAKIPPRRSQDRRLWVGDNIYRPLVPSASGPLDFELIPNISHFEGQEAHDIGGKQVLVSRRFIYFGRNAIPLPADLRPDIPKGQSAAGSSTRDIERAKRLVVWIEGRHSLNSVIAGNPHEWESDGVACGQSGGNCNPPAIKPKNTCEPKGRGAKVVWQK